MGKVFYIADLHFGHKNIIRYDNRPFSTIEEMDDRLIKNWNEVVGAEDTVFILGDIGWYEDEKLATIFENLKGTKILIKGNHDSIAPESRLARCFQEITDYKEYYLSKKSKVILSHYPIPFWNGQFRDSIHLYGHIHNSYQHNIMESWKKELRQLQDISLRCCNVGCMMPWMDYTPRTLEELEASGALTK